MEKSRAIELLEHLAWDRDIERNPYVDALNMAIDALKAQLSQEGTTSDLISRQAAIDAVNNAFDRETLLAVFVRSIALRAIRDMPPAQPEHKVRFADKDHVWIDGKQYISLPRFQEAVKEAQPKEGHWIEGGIYRDVIECNCSECGQLMTTAATVRMNFCPNCGARMKGERQK